MANSGYEDSKVIVLDPERQFSSSDSLMEVLMPYLKQEVLNHLNGTSEGSSPRYNDVTHEVVSHQGGAA